MTKGSWVYCPSHMFSKTCIFPYFDIISHLFSFWNPFPPPTSPPFSQLYLQSKTFFNIRAIPSGAVFCNNAMLTTIPVLLYYYYYCQISTVLFSFVLQICTSKSMSYKDHQVTAPQQGSGSRGEITSFHSRKL